MIWEYKTSRLSQQLNVLVWRPVPSIPQACVYASASTVRELLKRAKVCVILLPLGSSTAPCTLQTSGKVCKMNEWAATEKPSYLMVPSISPSAPLWCTQWLINYGWEWRLWNRSDVGIITPCVCMIISRLLKMDKAAIIGLQPTRNLRGSRWSIWAFSVL